MDQHQKDALASRTLWARLRRQLIRLTGAQDVDDHLHAAFMKLEAYRAREQVRNPEAFLVRAAANSALDEHRRARRQTAVAPLDEGLADTLADDAPLQDEVYAARQRLDRVREGIARLPPRTREIFLMHRLDGLKYHEIAARLGISQSAVEKHIAKAALALAEWAKGW
ncbi:RNA polymerase sigma-70 factor (ECF subfamily) [Nitrospirillum amazonense]|uniref:RNA polymerase sigma-70 factor (ECF subfamily) n=1 Tax=Nitrospirillum amazonense TaxID=28077 RepID=A0A560FFW8_9PROT|nr:RNA polymerase sigma factor [Nitrospirillum amazonense]TWB20489.1 RNA polymerase sigma-70 factor (ECF subfamily) [Nitrospirillum amazonense]